MKRRGPGQPSKGARARNVAIAVRFSRAEVAAIEAAVAQRNADSLARGEEPRETVSSWIRRHALEGTRPPRTDEPAYLYVDDENGPRIERIE